jgi:hypothetical protein
MPTQSELHHHRLPNCPRTTDTIQWCAIPLLQS